MQRFFLFFFSFPRVIRDRRKRRTSCTGDPRLTGRSRRGTEGRTTTTGESRIPRRFISVGGQRCAFPALALETWPSGVVDQRICPFVFALSSVPTKSLLFHGLEDPSLPFSDPRPPLNYTFLCFLFEDTWREYTWRE